MRHTPSTRQYSLGPRAGKILFGRKCIPVVMKQEGTVSFGKRPKHAPRPHSGMCMTKSLSTNEANKWNGRHSLQDRQAIANMLNFLVEREMRLILNYVAELKVARRGLRTTLLQSAQDKVEAGYRIIRGELAFS